MIYTQEIVRTPPAHTHTPPTKPLYPPVSSSSVSSTRVWAWGLSALIKQI